MVVNCRFPASPPTIPEGITASKGFVHYFDPQPVNTAPPFVDANRTVFHISQ